MENKIRLAIVVSHPIQHFVHFYRAISKLSHIELLVIFASDLGARSYYDVDMKQDIEWSMDLFGGYNYIVLPESENIKKTGFFEINNPSVADELSKFAPQVVMISGYSQLTTLRTWCWCLFKGVPTMMWSDSNLKPKRRLFKRFIKYPLLYVYYKFIKAFLSIGDNNALYYQYHGVKKSEIFRVPFTIDEQEIKLLLSNKREVAFDFRRQHKLSKNAFIVLIVGKLISRKRPFDLIEALEKLMPRIDRERPFYAVFAGNGELSEELKSMCNQAGLPCIFLGFVNVDTLPSVYVASDVLVHCAEVEPYGLVVREAACAGLPLILSDTIGAIGEHDAARENINALIYRCGDIMRLSELLYQLYINRDLHNSMSVKSKMIDEEIGVAKSVKGIIDAIDFSLSK